MPRNVVTFTRHKLARCECGDVNCHVCTGGLAYCTTCGGGEGSLPTHCPQTLMPDVVEQSVYAGELDYNLAHGGWTEWTPARRNAIKRLVT